MSKPDTQSLHEFAWEIVLDHAQDIERMSVGEIMADNSMFEELTEDEFDEVEGVIYNQASAYAKALTKPDEQDDVREQIALDLERTSNALDQDAERYADERSPLLQAQAEALWDAARQIRGAALDAHDANGGE